MGGVPAGQPVVARLVLTVLGMLVLVFPLAAAALSLKPPEVSPETTKAAARV